jgi:DHA1 family bicyclomycin/chloramphenicol resistance-like MFS transporter
MLTGVVLFMLCSAACALAWSIESLIAFRVLQGLSAACEAVIGWAVIKELYGEKDGVRVVAIFSMVIAVAPAIGPVIGSQMLVGLAAVTIVALWVFLRETATPDRQALRPSRIIAEAHRTVRVPAFWLYTIGPAAALGGLFAFVTEGPFVLIDQMGLTPDVFGYYYAAVVACFIATNLTVNRVSKRVEGAALLRLGSVLALSGGGLALLLAATGWIAPWSLCLAVALFVSSMALVYSVAPLKALASTDAATGMASSIRGCLEMLGAMLGSAGVAVLHDGTPWPLVIVMAVAAVCMASGNWGAEQSARRMARA